MLTNAKLSADGNILSITVPFKVRKRGGRKMIIAPEGMEAAWATPEARPDAALVKALARAHRWKRMLDSGRYGSIKELADAEKLTDSYIGNLLRLTLLAPDIVEGILDGRLPKGVGLTEFMKRWPLVWADQKAQLRALSSL
jgi:hypothetical protein